MSDGFITTIVLILYYLILYIDHHNQDGYKIIVEWNRLEDSPFLTTLIQK